MQMIKTSFKTKLALIFTILLWGSAYPGIRAGLTSYSPGGLAILRFLVASCCMFIIYFNLKRKNKINFKDGSLLLLIGAITIGTYHLALNYGEMTVSAGVASISIILSPIITVLFSVLFLKERISKVGILGILICVSGVTILAFHGSDQQMGINFGFICVLISAFASGIYSVLQKPFLSKYNAIDVTAYILWGATLFLLMFVPDLYHDFATASLSATLAGLYLGVFPAAIAYVLWTYAMCEISASRASVSMYYLPVVATFLGWVWLGEVPALISILGGLVIFAGVAVVNYSYRRPQLQLSLEKNG